jgi:hypothetical protein
MIVVCLVCSLVAVPIVVGYFYRSLLLRDRKCPHCKSQLGLERTPRTGLDRSIGHYISSRKYRCVHCGWKGLIRDKAMKPINEPAGKSGFEIDTVEGLTNLPGSELKG